MTRRRHPVLNAISMGLSAGFLAFILLLAVLVIVLPLVVGGSPLTVLTSSMEPKLPPGTLVVVKPTPVSDIRIGDVITYQLYSGQPEVVTHRVIERVSSSDGTVSFITKGDANGVPDANPVREVQVRGTVWYSIPWLGWVNTWLTGERRAIVVPIAAGLLFAYAGWMVFSGLRDRARKRRAARDRAAEAETARVSEVVAPAEPAMERHAYVPASGANILTP